MASDSITVRLAWRNIWRSRRRTFLTLLTIFVGCAMIILLNAFAKGGHDRMIEDAVGLRTGHIQIHEKGFEENMTIDYAFQPDAALLDWLQTDRRIAGYSMRVMTGGLLSFRDNTRGCFIMGIDPERERMVSDINGKILPGGRFLEPADDTHVLLGSILAKNVGAAPGDKIAILTQGFDGSVAAERLKIVGLIASGDPEMDRTAVVIPLNRAMDTFSMMGFIHSITIRLKEISLVHDVQRDLVRVTKGGDTPLEIMGWEELMPELVQFIVMDNFSAYIFDVILFVVVAFGILNTVQMSVFERTREFGVMISIGTRPGNIFRMILMESAFITVFGVLLGVAAGCAISGYFQINPIDYSSHAKEIAVWGFSTTIFPTKTTWQNIGLTSGIMCCLGMLFSVFPARRAARLNPIQAIRTL